MRILLKRDDRSLLVGCHLTNDITGDGADQAHNRAFSTSVFSASKSSKVYAVFRNVYSGFVLAGYQVESQFPSSFFE